MSDSLWDLVDGNWGSIRAVAGTARELSCSIATRTFIGSIRSAASTVESLGDGFDGDQLVMVDGTPHVLDGPATLRRRPALQRRGSRALFHRSGDR